MADERSLKAKIMGVIFSFISKLWRNCYVELHMFAFWFGCNFHIVASFPAMYDNFCRSIFDSDEICSNLSEYKDEENQVQTVAARWIQYIEIAKFFPNIIAALILGKYSDLNGVKVPILFSLTSSCLQLFFLMLSISSAIGWPLYSLVIGAFFTQFGGAVTVFVASEFAQVANIEQDEKKLTFRYSVLIAAWNIGFIVSGYILPILLSVLSYQSVMVIGQAIITLTFISVLFSYKSITEREEKPKELAETNSQTSIISNSSEQNNELQIDTIQRKVKPNILQSVRDILTDAWQTLTKRRPNNERLYLYIILIVGLIAATTDMGLDSLVTLYVYRAPLSWGPEDYAYWSAAMYVSTTIGGVLAAYILIRFKITDLTIVLIGLVSAMGKMAVISVANESWIMYVSLAIGAISPVGMSSLRAVLALLGDKNETGSLMALQTLVMSWCILFGAIVFNNIYTASLTFFPGLSFAFDACLLFLCFLAMLFVRIDYYRKNNTNDKNFKSETTKL